jgi:hypothetical protein
MKDYDRITFQKWVYKGSISPETIAAKFYDYVGEQGSAVLKESQKWGEFLPEIEAFFKVWAANIELPLVHWRESWQCFLDGLSNRGQPES